MGLMEMRLRIESGIGGDERQIMLIGQFDEPSLRALLILIAATRYLDVQPAGEQGDQAFQDRLGRRILPLADEPHQGAVCASGEGDQPLRSPPSAS